MLAADTIAMVWVALDALMVVRLVTLGARFAGGRWALARRDDLERGGQREVALAAAVLDRLDHRASP